MTQHQGDKVLPRTLHWSSLLMFAIIGTYAAGFLRISIMLFAGITFDGMTNLSDVAGLILGLAFVIVATTITGYCIHTIVMLRRGRSWARFVMSILLVTILASTPVLMTTQPTDVDVTPL